MSTRLLDLRTPEVSTTTTTALTDNASRLPLVDRASLRVGLWLLLRSARKAEHQADHSVRSLRLAQHRAHESRESAARRLQQLSPRL